MPYIFAIGVDKTDLLTKPVVADISDATETLKESNVTALVVEIATEEIVDKASNPDVKFADKN